MPKLRFHRAAFSLLLVLAAALCHAQTVTVEPADSACSEIVAPRLFTRAFLVSNSVDARRKFAEEVTLPEGWQLIGQDTSFVVGPSSRELRLLAILVPLNAVPGRYIVSYSITDRVLPSQHVSAQTEVLVLPVFKLDITTRDVPQRVLAGEDYTAQFVVTNRSNTACTASAQLLSSGGLSAVLSNTEWLAGPGESKVLTAVVRTDGKTSSSFKHRLTLKVKVTDAETPQKESIAHASVEVIPRTVAPGDFYHRVPSMIAMRYVSEQGGSGLQMEYSGTGSLDARGSYRVGYLFRGPRDLERNTFGLRDEYFVTVESKSVDARVGDLSFNVSPLMEQNRLARGAKASVSQGHFSAGGYAFRMRPKYPGLEESSGFLGFATGGRFSTRLNFLRKSSRSVHGDLLGLSTNISPLRGSNLELEMSADARGNALGADRRALLARFNGSLGGARLTLEHVQAGKNFAGYYHDENHSVISAFMPVYASLQFHASYRTSAQNLSHDILRPSAMREANIQSGIAYTFPFRTSLNLDAEQLTRADELGRTNLDYREQSGTLRLRQTYHWVTVSGSVKRGLWDNSRLSTKGDVERYGFGLNIAPDSRQSYSAAFQTGTSGYAGNGSLSRTLNLTANYKIAGRLTLGLSFQKASVQQASLFENDQFAADIRCEVYRHQALSLRVRKMNYAVAELSRGLSWMATYEIPVGMPVGKQSTVGCVKGQVFDAEDPQGKGLAGVVLTLDGLTAITDSKGRYVFPSVTPGVHYLQVDKASIGLFRTTTRRVPVELKVRGGRSEILNLGVTRSGSLRGQMALFGRGGSSSRGYLVLSDSLASQSADSGALEQQSGLGGVELELRGADEVFRTVTDRDGHFSFTDLRPGKWELLVAKDGMPAFHQPEQSHYEVYIQPAESEELAVRVTPRTRSLIIVDEGSLPVINTSSRK